MLIDTHAHLEMTEYDQDRDEVVKRAVEAGLKYIITVGTTAEDCVKAVDLARRYGEVYASVGIHPHNAREIDRNTYDNLLELAREEKVVAYGEIGLDFFHDHSPRPVQLRRFGEQLELAWELKLPVIIHSREAHREVMETIYPWRGRLRGVFHCFSGDREMAKKCVDLGFYISVTGVITYPKSDQLKEVVKALPLDALLLETDCPYLTPQPWRGQRNEPAYVAQTAQTLAEVLELTPERIGEVTSQNAGGLFSIPR